MNVDLTDEERAAVVALLRIWDRDNGSDCSKTAVNLRRAEVKLANPLPARTVSPERLESFELVHVDGDLTIRHLEEILWILKHRGSITITGVQSVSVVDLLAELASARTSLRQGLRKPGEVR